MDQQHLNEGSAEHIIVCLSSAPSNARIIRTAARMATALGAIFTALYVQTANADRIASEDRQRLQYHIRLAESLGATVATVIGEDIPYQIAEYARLSKVTKIVLGRSSTVKNHFWGRKPLNEKLIELVPELDVFIIPDSAGDNKARRPFRPRIAGLALWQVGLTLLILAAATGVGFLFQSLNFTQANIITVYILAALLIALFTRSYVCGGFGSLAGVLVFNFFFTVPRHTLHAYESGYPVTFVVMLVASLLTGMLANRLAEHARQSTEAAYRTKVLFDTSQLLQKAGSDREILELTAGQLLKLLDRELIVYPAEGDRLGEGLRFAPENRIPTFSGQTEVARWAFENKKRAGATTGVFSEAQGMYLAIRSIGAAYGVVGIAIGDKPLEPFENSVLLSILGECALAMENSRNAREKEQAAVLAKNEQLRANLLRAISHDLRTPLTSISGNVENLLANDGFIEGETRRQVLSDIYDDSIWLIQLVENLLAITRIGEGRMNLTLSAQLVDEVIAEALKHVKRSDHEITVDVKDELMLAQMDARLISQVIVNLVDNAIKYTPAGAPIHVSAEMKDRMAVIRVADEGPGIPDSQKPKVFDMFFTGENHVADCRRSLGLGLALCRSIVSAHGGEITLEDNHPHGSVFTFTLPASEVTLHE